MSCVFFFKQKTAYDMRISDWSSDVCSSDLRLAGRFCRPLHRGSFSSFAALAGAEGVRAARARMASAAPSFMSDLRLAVVVEGAACGSRLSATGTIGLPAVHRSLRSVGPGTANHRRYSPGCGVGKL